MPTYEVRVRYLLEWVGSKIIQAQSEEAAQRKVESAFADVHDYATFAKFIDPESSIELEDEALYVDDVEEL